MRDVAAGGFPAVRPESSAAHSRDPAQTRAAFFNQSTTDRQAGRMSVSMERTEGCLKASIEVPV